MEAKEKLEALKAFLTRKGIEHWTDSIVQNWGEKKYPCPECIELFIPKYAIAVRIGEDQDWYKAVRPYVHPVFIRESENVDFIIKKVKNTMYSPVARVWASNARWFRKNLVPTRKFCVRTRKRKKITPVRVSHS